ncbi:hypothetical protein [Shouchella clausii]|uniref:hypothetical protein n=1 Tax=Shouchella clausii TaxID=79880 RepID=UPI0016532DB3|nr:hypothetical protein [Shouchella clausii]QNM43768.1 hypothetical protein DUT88_13060 [Shouchella clausii]
MKTLHLHKLVIVTNNGFKIASTKFSELGRATDAFEAGEKVRVTFDSQLRAKRHEQLSQAYMQFERVEHGGSQPFEIWSKIDPMSREGREIRRRKASRKVSQHIKKNKDLAQVLEETRAEAELEEAL